MDSKVCSHCGEEKPASAFSRNLKAPDGLDYRCIACRRIYHLKHVYGITGEQFDALFAAQDFRCGVCGRTEDEAGNKYRFHVDHQHSPPFWIRGILCSFCNRHVISRIEDADLMRKAADYLADPVGKRLMPEHSVPHKPRRRRAKPKGSK